MKKLIFASVGAIAMGSVAFGQGSLAGINNTGLYFATGVGNQDVATAPGSAYYVGGLTMDVYFSTTATANDISTINGYNGAANGGASALAALSSWTLVATATGSADSQINSFPDPLALNSSFGPGTAGSFVFFFSENGLGSGVAFGGATYGGDLGATPAGTPYNVGGTANSDLNTFANTYNVALTSTTPVPEPSTLAMAGLGGLGMLMAFRRKKA